METFERSIQYTNVAYTRKGKGTAVVLGNEVTGIDTNIIPQLDEIVEIPMFGAKNSRFMKITKCH